MLPEVTSAEGESDSAVLAAASSLVQAPYLVTVIASALGSAPAGAHLTGESVASQSAGAVASQFAARVSQLPAVPGAVVVELCHCALAMFGLLSTMAFMVGVVYWQLNPVLFELNSGGAIKYVQSAPAPTSSPVTRPTASEPSVAARPVTPQAQQDNIIDCAPVIPTTAANIPRKSKPNNKDSNKKKK